MKQPRTIILVAILLALPWAVLQAADEGGSISGVVVETRTGLEGQGELLVEVEGDQDDDQDGGTTVDEVVLDVARGLAKKFSAAHLPKGWELHVEGGTATASGPETKTPLRIRLDFGDGEVPEDLDVKILRAGQRLFRKKGIPVTPVSPAEVITELDEVIKVPPRITPGETIEMTPLDPEKTPSGGEWKFGEWVGEEVEPKDWGLEFGYSYSDYGFKLAPKIRWEIPESYTTDSGITIRYRDKFGDTVLEVPPTHMMVEFKDPDWTEQPRITDCTSMSFTERIICVCGYFPTPESQNAVLIDGKPLGPPLSSSKRVLHFRLPEGVGPGDHRIFGRSEVGFPTTDIVDIIVIRIGGAIDRDKLFRGESTDAHLWVEGTEDPVELLLKNHTPLIISFEGGDEQVVTTSGGDPNDVKRTVKGIKAGEFNITYRLTVADCPCVGQEIDEDDSYYQPQGETFFDDAVAHYRRGRELATRAKDAAWYGDESADELALEALRELQRSRIALQDGIEDGDIGENVTRTLTRFLDQEVAKANTVLKDPPEEPVPFEPPAMAPPPEEPPPYAYITEGAFEPCQGVWQDDVYFEDKPTKQLTQIEPALWEAELKMVAGRDTLIFGTRENQHTRIVFKGKTNGTKKVKVRHRFTLIQGGSRTTIWEEPRAYNWITIDGPTGPEKEFSTSLVSDNGLPEPGQGTAFRILPGPYIIECELIRTSGEPTGLAVAVAGTAVHTSGPTLRFVPTILYPPYSPARRASLRARARTLATISMEDLELWFPIANGSLKAFVGSSLSIHNLNDSLYDEAFQWAAGLFSSPGQDAVKNVRKNKLETALTDYFATSSTLTGGSKNLVVLDDADFNQIEAETIGAYAPAQKLIILRDRNSASTVAHEVIHTSNHLWSEEEMERMFDGKNWHNWEQDHQAHGADIGDRKIKEGLKEIMGTTSGQKWITQGTYWHLLNIFQAQPDPELFVVRAICARRSGDGQNYEFGGELLESYTIMGVPDLLAASDLTPEDPRSSAGWSVVLTDRSGEMLSRNPFQAVWRPADTSYDRSVISAVWRIPTHPDTAAIELHGPNGMVDEIRLSTSAPTVRITSPAADATVNPTGDKLSIRWSGSDPDGDPLVYSVLYSPDGGETWRREGAEVTGTEFTIDVIGRPAEPMIRVLATDGARSGEAEVSFRYKR